MTATELTLAAAAVGTALIAGLLIGFAIGRSGRDKAVASAVDKSVEAALKLAKTKAQEEAAPERRALVEPHRLGAGYGARPGPPPPVGHAPHPPRRFAPVHTPTTPALRSVPTDAPQTEGRHWKPDVTHTGLWTAVKPAEEVSS